MAVKKVAMIRAFVAMIRYSKQIVSNLDVILTDTEASTTMYPSISAT